MKIKIVILILMLANASLFAQVNVRDFGAKGNGLADDYPAILAAVDHLNKLGTGTLYFPKGVYMIKAYHSGKNKIRDIEFKNISGLKIQGNNSKIVINGNFYRKADRLSGKYSYSSIKTVIPFYINNCNNVSISDLEIDGGVSKMSRDSKVVESGGHILMISSSKNVKLNNLNFYYAQTDGIYITGDSKNVNASNVQSNNNARQGMSLIHLGSGNFLNCRFENNGLVGKYGAHAPASGLDIEPAGSGFGVGNVKFDKCTFRNNAGSQIIVTKPSTTHDISFTQCVIDAGSSKGKYQLIFAGTNIEVSNNDINCGGGNLYPIWDIHKNSTLLLRGNKIRSSSNGVLAANKNSRGLVMENNILEYTGSNVVQSYFPYIIGSFVINNNTIIIPAKYVKIKGPTVLITNAREKSGNTLLSDKKRTFLK